jgi:predicted lipoprotein
MKIANRDFDFSLASDLKRKGLPALDYLLYESKLNSLNHFDMLDVLIKELNSTTATVVNEWSSSGKNYLTEYSSKTGSDAGSSVGLTLNALLLHLERFHREGKIGIPNGERSFSGTALPLNVEGTYQGSESLKYAIENLKAIERLYLGTDHNGNDGIGLEENLIEIGAKYNGGSLDAAIKSQFKACFNAYAQINMPLNEAVVNQNDAVSKVFKEIQKLVVLLKTDVPSSLGILITYTDNDGD